ncbi:MAG: hypothetical protein AAGA65_23910 [Actinomycetota bacterium]
MTKSNSDALGLVAIGAAVAGAAVLRNADGTALTIAILAVPASIVWLSRRRLRNQVTR